ncbi:SAM-dependent methyltransferase [Actinopolymorpha sp. B9G3]|uniref:TRM11 family SAM-dependent methyltransferase n=1 Tax=Actinopolymorpha sp. B9G3 TaxID=3158970 RepID=UPI0032D95EB1
MPRYALLILPATNRVYAEASVDLLRAELAVFAERALAGRLGEVEEARLGGVPYLLFTAEELSGRDIAYLSQLSSLYALFEVSGADGDPSRGAGDGTDLLLRPVELTPLAVFDDDLLTIQKYAGKTNEYFTKLLLNVTVLSSDFADAMLDRRLHVFDPLCGRGTTLNQALMYGYDATGLEHDSKDVEAYSAFIRTWLKRKRLKHQAEFTPVRRDRKVIGRRLHVMLAADKEAYKAGDALSLTVVNGDTTRARDFFRPRSFDVVVADAPYGVQHGSRMRGGGDSGRGGGDSGRGSEGARGSDGRRGGRGGDGGGGSLSRRPLDLLRAAVPAWVELLRPGGAVGISWNIHGASRDDAAQVLRDAGLDVCEGAAYEGFQHRVDQAIIRDILVAQKP